MTSTTIKSVFRRFLKQPVFFAINGIGLTLGLMTFLFIMQYVVFQWGFNNMYAEGERSFRVLDAAPEKDLSPYTVPGMVPRVKENIPGVELATRYMQGIGSGVILVEDKTGLRENIFREDKVVFVDHDFLSLFERPTVKGSPELSQPNTMVLTVSTALQYFQTTDIIGASITLVNQFGEHPFQVTGVIEDYPENSDISANVLASMITFESKEYIGANTWMNINNLNSSFVFSFVRLATPEAADNLTQYWAQVQTEGNPQKELNVELQSIADMHLDKGASGQLPSYGDARMVWFLMILAVLILTIAWINYVNLSTSQSLKKAQSISVKKVIGASRKHLMIQQLTETFLLTGMSVLLAIIGCIILQPFFNYLVDYQLHLSQLLDWRFLLGMMSFLIFTSLTAGFYVGIVLTGFDPSLMLKGSFRNSRKGILVRKSLVTAQFVISIAFIAGTGIMLMQISYLQNRDLGFTAEQRLAILGPADFTAETIASKNVFLDQIAELPFIQQFSAAGGIPGRGTNFSFSNLSRDKETVEEGKTSYSMVFIDDKFFDIYGIDLIAGQPITDAMVETGWWNSQKIILNETAARSLGYENPADAVQEIVYYGADGREFEIQAVVQDYNHRSLHNEIAPMAFGAGRNHVWFTLLLNGPIERTQLDQLAGLYKTHFPKSPFIHQFVDEYYHDFYEADRRLGQLISTATFLVIFISCLGLFGLVAYTVEKRTKEIGIRKVLGASISSIVGLITKDFFPLMVLAIFIATPITYYLMYSWLEDFAYRIEIQWWVFLLAGLAAILIALFTISFQSVKAALTNPVHSLRNE